MNADDFVNAKHGLSRTRIKQTGAEGIMITSPDYIAPPSVNNNTFDGVEKEDIR